MTVSSWSTKREDDRSQATGYLMCARLLARVRWKGPNTETRDQVFVLRSVLAWEMRWCLAPAGIVVRTCAAQTVGRPADRNEINAAAATRAICRYENTTFALPRPPSTACHATFAHKDNENRDATRCCLERLLFYHDFFALNHVAKALHGTVST